MQRGREVKLGERQRVGNGRSRGADDALDTDAGDKVLHVRREAERHSLGRVEERLPLHEG